MLAREDEDTLLDRAVPWRGLEPREAGARACIAREVRILEAGVGTPLAREDDDMLTPF